MLQVTPIPAFNDNYIWLLQHTATGRNYVVDPGCGSTVANYLHQHQLTLAGILITHHHQDHTGGIKTLQARSEAPIPVYGPKKENIAGLTHTISDDDKQISLDNNLDVDIIHLPGHTLGHIAYKISQHVFCGDTLFNAGCGRLFEGTAKQMHASLSKLAALDDDTLFYPAHEYTLSNLAFATQVDPDNVALSDYLQTCQLQRQKNQPTLPTKLTTQLSINPFLRVDKETIQSALSTHFQTHIADPVHAFALLRQWKDSA